MKMKVSYRPKVNLLIEFEAADKAELVDSMAAVQEVTLQPCGHCKCEDTFYRKRTVGEHTYREMVCPKCHHTLTFGLGKGDDGLYPRRKEMDGTKPKVVDGKHVYLPDNGWTKYTAESKD